VTSTLVIRDAKPDDAGTVECADKKEPFTDKSSAIIIFLKHGNIQIIFCTVLPIKG